MSLWLRKSIPPNKIDYVVANRYCEEQTVKSQYCDDSIHIEHCKNQFVVVVFLSFTFVSECRNESSARRVDKIPMREVKYLNSGCDAEIALLSHRGEIDMR
jgi:hypothetical protein